MTNETKARIAMGMAVGFALLAATLCWLLFSWGQAARTPPSPGAPPSTGGDPAAPSPDHDLRRILLHGGGCRQRGVG